MHKTRKGGYYIYCQDVCKFCVINLSTNFLSTFFFHFSRRHIEVHGRPTPAVFRKKPRQAGKNSYLLVWTVDSYTPIQEYRLLYRQIKPFHPVKYFSFFMASRIAIFLHLLNVQHYLKAWSDSQERMKFILINYVSINFV